MKTPPDKTVTFTLYSHPMKDLRLRWRATLTFPPGATDSSVAELRIADGEGAPIVVGTFAFAGVEIPVREGVGRLNCGAFARGKHETAIWLYRKGVMPVPGALTFE